MAENLKKYTDAIQKTVVSLNKVSQSVDSKIRELVVVLTAAQQGLIKGEAQINGALEGVTRGKFESASTLKTYLNRLDLVEKDVDKIVNYWEKLQNLSVDELKRSKEYYKITSDLPDLFEEIVDSTNKISDNTTDILKTETDRLDLVGILTKRYQEFSKNVLQNKELLKSVNIDLTKNVGITNDFLNTAEQILPNLFISDLIDSKQIDKLRSNLEALQQGWATSQPTIQMPSTNEVLNIDDARIQIEEMSKEMLNSVSDEFKLRDKLLQQYIASSMNLKLDPETNSYSDMNTGLELSADLTAKTNQLILEKSDMLSSIAEQLISLNSLDETTRNNLKNQLNSLDAVDKILVGQMASHVEILRLAEKQAEVNQSSLKYYDTLMAKIEKFRPQIDQIGDSLQNVFDVVPYGMQRMLGIDRINDQISQSLTAGMTNFAQATAAGVPPMQALTGAAGTFGTTLSSALGPMTLIVAAIAAAIALVKGLEDNVSNLSKELGISRSIAKQMVHDTQQLVSHSQNRFVTEEKILEIQKSQLEKFGRVLDLNKNTNRQLIDTAVTAEQAYGIMATDAMEVMNIFQRLGADNSLSQQLLADIAYMSELAGMSPNIIAKDLIEGSKEVSLYFAGMPKQAAKAIVQIRRMGMSLKQAGQIADKMLNIEGFMTDMYELAAMTSGGMNLSEAFDLRMKGDIEGMTKSIMNQIGTLDNFNSQSEFVQRKLANTLGMEVDELKKSVKLKEISGQLSEDQVKILQQNLDKVGDIGNMSIANMKAKAEELNSTQRLSVAFGKIKSILYKALLPIIETIADTLSSSSGIVEGIGAGFKFIGGAIQLLTPIIKGFFIPFKWAGDVITMISGWISSWFDPIESAGNSVASLNTGLADSFGIISKISQGIGVFFGAKYLSKLVGLNTVFNKSFDMIAGKSAATGQLIADNLSKPSLFKPVLDKFSNLGGKLSGVFSKINPFQTLTKTAEQVDLTKPLIGNVEKNKGILSKAFDKINIFKKLDPINLTESINTPVTPKVEIPAPDTTKIQKSGSAFETISNIFKKSGELIKTVLSSMKDLVIGFFDTISQSLSSLGKGIGSFFQSTLGGIGDGLSKFQPKAIIGAAALLVIASALWVTADALKQFNDINPESLALAATSLIGLGAAASIFGMASGLIVAGSIAIGAASAALWLFGKAISSIGDSLLVIEPIITSFFKGISLVAGTVITGINTIFQTLSSIDISSLLMVGPALFGIAAGLAAIGGGSVVQGLTSLFSGDPFIKLEKLATLANPLNIVAGAVKSLTDSIGTLGSVLDVLNIDELNSISDKAIEINKTDAIQSTASIITQPLHQIAAISNTPTITPGSEYNTNNQISNVETNQSSEPVSTVKLERLMRQMIEEFRLYANRPAVAVLENESQNNLFNKFKGKNNK